MTVPRTVAEVLDEHVTLEVECIDRMYLNLYQPKLMWPGGVVGFFKEHRGMPFVSSALMDPITKDFVASIHRFIADNGLDLVHFEKGQRKDDVAHDYLARHDGTEGILFVGRAQEKTTVFRTEKRVNAETGRAYPWIVTATAMVNHFYFYGVDDDFGPFFIKFGTYFPCTAKVCINGHHWAERQAANAGIGVETMDNAFAACDNPRRLQKVCDRLGPAHIDRFVRKWLARLPHPFTPADRRAGYRYDISVLQAEFSLTQMLDRPLAGRVFFEEVIRDNLDAGRPDQVSLTFARRVTRRTPGRFRTRILTDGVIPSIHVDYKRSRIKQYLKEGRALRTECTINDTRKAHRFERRCARSRLKFTGSSDARLGPGRRRRGGCRLGPSRRPPTPVWDRGWRPDRPDGWREGGETLSLTERRHATGTGLMRGSCGSG